MRLLKTIFLSKVTIVLLLNAFFFKPVLFIFSLAFLLIDSFSDSICFLILFLLISFTNTYRYDFIPIGTVEKTTKTYALVEKGLYRVKLFNTSLKKGDVVIVKTKEQVSDEEELKKNILFSGERYEKVLCSSLFRQISEKRVKTLEEQYGVALGRILMNDYDDDLYLGYGFYFYFFLLFLYRKKKKLAIVSFFVYILIFGFELKLLAFVILALSDFLKLSGINKLCFRVILILVINRYLILNYSFLISLAFSLLSLFSSKRISIMMGALEILFFKKISFVYLWFFSYFTALRIILFVGALSCFVFSFLCPLYGHVLKAAAFFFSLDSLALRGSLNLLSLLFIVIVCCFVKSEKGRYVGLLVGVLLFSRNIFPAVTFIEVGQGDAALISGPFGSYQILIDTASPYNYRKLQNYLFSKGIYELDYVLISHEDNDHSGNKDNLLKDFRIDRVIEEKGNIAFKNLYFDELDSGIYESDNANSLIYYLDFYGFTYLFTGDINKEVELKLDYLGLLKKTDVLKVSHHGSDTSSSERFIKKIQPDYAVISTDGSYGHPKEEVLNCLKANRVMTYITRDQGNISFVASPFGRFVKWGFANFDIIEK